MATHMMGGTPDSQALGQFMRGMSFGKDNNYDYAAKLFGQPNNPNPQRQMHLDEVQDRQLPFYLEGRSKTLEQIITGIGYISPVFETKYLLPYREIDTIEFNWNEMHFNTDIAGAVPHRGQSRMLTFSQKNYQASSVRRGLAIMAEHDRLTTEQGVRDYLLQIASLANSIEETAASDVMHTLFSFGYANYVHETAEGFNGVPLQSLISHERDQFGILQKDQDQFHAMVNKYREIIKQNSGEYPDVLVIPTGTRAFLAAGDAVKTTYWFRGPGRIDMEVDGPEAYSSIQGLMTFEMRPSQTYNDYVNSTDLSTRSVSIGEYYIISNPYINQNGTTMDDFRTDQYNTTVYSFDHDTFRPLSVREAVTHCGRFEWRKTGQSCPPTRDDHNKLIGRRNADIPPEYSSYFNAQHYIKDAATFYNQKESRGAITMHLGDIEIDRESWQFEDTRAFAEILSSRIRRDNTTTDFVATWNAMMDMVMQIEAATPSGTYIDAVRESAAKYEPAATADDLVEAYGGQKWSEIGFNPSTGTIDLPGQTGKQADWPDYPAFFANWPGINAIARQSDTGHFAGLKQTAANFVRMWNSITTRITRAMPNSLFVNAAHRPVNMPKLDEACTLFHTLVLPPRAPAFIRTAAPGGRGQSSVGSKLSPADLAVNSQEERILQGMVASGAAISADAFSSITAATYDRRAFDIIKRRPTDIANILKVARTAVAGFGHGAIGTGADKVLQEMQGTVFATSEKARQNAITGSAVIRALGDLDAAAIADLAQTADAARAGGAAETKMGGFVKNALRAFSGDFQAPDALSQKALAQMLTDSGTSAGNADFRRSPLTFSPQNLRQLGTIGGVIRPPNGLVDNEFAADDAGIAQIVRLMQTTQGGIPLLEEVSAGMSSPGQVRELEHLHFIQQLRQRGARRQAVRTRNDAGFEATGAGMQPVKRSRTKKSAAFSSYTAETGTESGSAQAADFFRKITNQNFTERMREAERIPDWLTRTIAACYLGCQYNGETLDALMKSDLPIPYSFVAVRLNMTFRVSSAIIMVSGIKGNTGFMAITGVNFQLAHDANTKYMFGNLTLYMKAICAQRRKVAHMDNIVVKGYVGGAGVDAFAERTQWITEQSDRYASSYQTQDDGQASVFYFMLPYRAADNMPVAFDVTGQWQYNHYAAIDQGMDNSVQWTGAGYYAMYWQWFEKMTNSGFYNVQEAESYYNNRDGRQNTIAIRGFHRRYDTGSRTHTFEEQGMGHLGPYCGPGFVGACTTLSRMFPSNPKTFTNQRAGVRGY